MQRTYTDMTGEYYDNLDRLIDLSASGFGAYRELDLKKLVGYTNGEK